jgi:hypothetical protein
LGFGELRWWSWAGAARYEDGMVDWWHMAWDSMGKSRAKRGKATSCLNIIIVARLNAVTDVSLPFTREFG